jgi:hypothetical protein
MTFFAMVILFWSVNCYHCHKTLFLTDFKPINGEPMHRERWVSAHFHDISWGLATCDWCKKELRRQPNADCDVVEVR